MITITDNEFNQIKNYVINNFGIDLSKKRVLIETRLQNYLAQKECNNFSDYYNKIVNDRSGSEIKELVNHITTNYTFFNRENSHFDYLKNQVLPYLTKNIDNRDLRIWSAGCSSGQEAYTLSMIVGDYFGKEILYWDTSILATDISNDMLEIAQTAIYTDQQIIDLPSAWKLNYINKIANDKNAIIDKIKKNVIFRKFNLMNEIYPFKKKFHVIFCRNVMIYFDNETKNKLVNKFYDNLEYGGYLFIGHSETVDSTASKFKYVLPAVYRKE